MGAYPLYKKETSKGLKSDASLPPPGTSWPSSSGTVSLRSLRNYKLPIGVCVCVCVCVGDETALTN